MRGQWGGGDGENRLPRRRLKQNVVRTVAISSVFRSFSSQVTVISWMSFSDSCSFSFSSGAFRDCWEKQAKKKKEKRRNQMETLI